MGKHKYQTYTSIMIEGSVLRIALNSVVDELLWLLRKYEAAAPNAKPSEESIQNTDYWFAAEGISTIAKNKNPHQNQDTTMVLSLYMDQILCNSGKYFVDHSSIEGV